MIKISRFAGYVAAMLLIVVFLSITGLSPSLMRAGLVSGISLFADYCGRKFHPGRLLIYVAAISALLNPRIILNLAWQLSFASYAGIMILAPLLEKYFYGRNKPGFIAEMIIITISAQLFCLPLSVYYFGQFSIVGLLANALVTPVIPCIMLLTFLCGVLPCGISSLIVYIDIFLLSYQINIIQWLSDIK